MSMSKKQYRMVAQAITDGWDRTVLSTEYEDELPWICKRLYRNIVDELKLAFIEDNPAFDARKFDEACGAYEGE